jgi:hypothetical protein
MRPDADLIATAHHKCYLTCPNANEGQFGRRGAHVGRRSISISRCLKILMSLLGNIARRYARFDYEKLPLGDIDVRLAGETSNFLPPFLHAGV